MKNVPKKVIITEVGPRDGFQLEAKMIPTEMKVRMIRGLAGAWLRGCPFVRGAAGNIVTEDAARLPVTIGIDTGVDIRKVSARSFPNPTAWRKTI